MPTLTMMAIPNSMGALVRTRLNQSTCGSTTLQKMSDQYTGAYGPVILFQIMKPSYLSAPYHAMKASIV